jgi:hypothetical protein
MLRSQNGIMLDLIWVLRIQKQTAQVRIFHSIDNGWKR